MGAFFISYKYDHTHYTLCNRHAALSHLHKGIALRLLLLLKQVISGIPLAILLGYLRVYLVTAHAKVIDTCGQPEAPIVVQGVHGCDRAFG